jgi:Uma2 family endonuclease
MARTILMEPKTMAAAITWEATIDDLYSIEGKAELVHGKIQRMSPAGDDHSTIAGEIYASLREYALRTRAGRAFADNTGFLCDLPNRRSFSPDAAFYDSSKPRSGKKFLPQPPTFAVEIRSENDYGPAAEMAMAEKRSDYFAAGTKAVWDVDADGPVIVRLYLPESPEQAIEFREGDIAHAEPVVPGWRLPVDDILEEIRRE